jgi:hypothetical protein
MSPQCNFYVAKIQFLCIHRERFALVATAKVLPAAKAMRIVTGTKNVCPKLGQYIDTDSYCLCAEKTKDRILALLKSLISHMLGLHAGGKMRNKNLQFFLKVLFVNDSL